jgi:hypothetical protein
MHSEFKCIQGLPYAIFLASTAKMHDLDDDITHRVWRIGIKSYFLLRDTIIFWPKDIQKKVREVALKLWHLQ